MVFQLDDTVEEKNRDGKTNFRDQDADEIVKRLEAKYVRIYVIKLRRTFSDFKGTQVSMQTTSKKSKKNKKALKLAPEDVMDKGLGYDLEDEFIDDEQAVNLGNL